MSLPLAETVQRAMVDALFEGAQEGSVDLGRLPITSLTLEQGLQVQLGVLGRWQEQGDGLGGWKVGLTSGAGRDSMGTGYRPFGYILQRRIFQSGAVLGCARGRVQQLEVELCIEIGDRLAGRGLAASTIAAAIRGVRPAFELNQLRLPPGAGPGITIADDLSHWGVVVGDLAPWTSSGAPHVVLERDGRMVAEVRPGDVAIDPPLVAVQRLCTRLADFGRALEPGELVLTGALVKVPTSTIGSWHAEVRGLGSVELAWP
jgi:2-keto-4-pentenoate hydratase